MCFVLLSFMVVFHLVAMSYCCVKWVLTDLLVASFGRRGALFCFSFLFYCVFFFFFFWVFVCFVFFTMYWLPKLNKKNIYKASFIANSGSCITTELSELLLNGLTAITTHVSRYCKTVFKTSGRNLFWTIKNYDEVLNKRKPRGFSAFNLSTYDFSTLYKTLPYNSIKEKPTDLGTT